MRASPYPAADALRRLLEAPRSHENKPEPLRADIRYGRTMLTVQSANRQGICLSSVAPACLGFVFLAHARDDVADRLFAARSRRTRSSASAFALCR